MLSLLSATDSTAASVVPVVDSWQLLSACTINIRTAQISDTLVQQKPAITPACLLCAAVHQYLAVKDVNSMNSNFHVPKEHDVSKQYTGNTFAML